MSDRITYGWVYAGKPLDIRVSFPETALAIAREMRYEWRPCVFVDGQLVRDKKGRIMALTEQLAGYEDSWLSEGAIQALERTILSVHEQVKS